MFETPPTLLQSAILHFCLSETNGAKLRRNLTPFKLASNLTGPAWYNAINRCVDKGWIKKRELSGKNIYKTTSKGKKTLAIAVKLAKVLIKKEKPQSN